MTFLENAEKSIEKVSINFWKKTYSKLKNYLSIQNENNNNNISIKIKSEPILYEFNSNQLEISRNSLIVFNQEISIKSEAQLDEFNQEKNLTITKISKSRKLNKTQMQQTIHLIKRKYKRIRSTKRAFIFANKNERVRSTTFNQRVEDETKSKQ